MTLTVLKPFPHRSRRFTIAQEITEADVVGSTITLADLKKGRFVAGADTKLAEAAIEKADDTAALAGSEAISGKPRRS